MGSLPNIRPAGASRQHRARRVAFVATLTAALCLTPPPAARASLNSDLKNLPSDASPKQACHVLIKHGAVKKSKEGKCRQLVAEGFDAAKTVSDSGTVTVASAAACTIQVFKQNLKAGEMARCSKEVAKSASDSGGEDGGGGGGGFNPIGAAGDAISGVVGGIGDAIGGAVTGTILDGFKSIIGLLFGGLQSAITVALIKWITTIPNLSGGHVGSLEKSIAIGASGLLAATMTISIVRFWGSGLTGDGAWAGAEGVARAAIAAVLIGLWPQIFSLAIRLANALQSGILGGGVKAQLKALFRDLDVIGLGGGALTGGLVPMFLAIVIAIVGILMLLALVAMKIVITALTIVLFCAMPLAFVVWPIPELAGIARFCLRSLAVVLAIPVVWCLIFGAFAAIGADTFSFSNTGKEQGIFGTALNVTIVRPLVAISLLYLALVVPKRLMQLAPFTGGRGPGFGRALATGATLRAGFHYAPQAARGFAGGWGAKSQLPLFDAASPVERAAAKGARAFHGATAGAAGAKAAGAGAGAGAAASGASKLKDQGTQAAKGAGQAQKGDQAAQGSQKAGAQGATEGAAQGAASRAEAGGQQAKVGEQKTKGMQLAGGAFNGPLTIDPSAAHREDIAAQRKEMAAGSKSGNGVSAAQVDAAIGDLKGQPELLGAAKRAAFHGNPKEATGAYAEWSLSDNEGVSPAHKSAFRDLGFASPEQRKEAFDRFEGGGATPSPRPSPAATGGERHVPHQGASVDPSPTRTPRPQPRQRGDQ